MNTLDAARAKRRERAARQEIAELREKVRVQEFLLETKTQRIQDLIGRLRKRAAKVEHLHARLDQANEKAQEGATTKVIGGAHRACVAIAEVTGERDE